MTTTIMDDDDDDDEHDTTTTTYFETQDFPLGLLNKYLKTDNNNNFLNIFIQTVHK